MLRFCAAFLLILGTCISTGAKEAGTKLLKTTRQVDIVGVSFEISPEVAAITACVGEFPLRISRGKMDSDVAEQGFSPAQIGEYRRRAAINGPEYLTIALDEAGFKM